jgi:molybdenum cofactor cytidylyltransferase
MSFGPVRVDECAGAVLAHSVRAGSVTLKKGRLLDADDARRLAEAGIDTVIVRQIGEGDVLEDEAARRIADAIPAVGITIGPAGTGRVNLHARHAGLFRADRARIDALNRIDPAITLASLADGVEVRADDMVATIKIIPLAVDGAALAQAMDAIAGAPALVVKPFAAARVGYVATQLPSLKPSVMVKTRRLLEARLAASGSHVVAERRVAHTTEAVAEAVAELMPASDMVIVFGASAVADPHDVIPAAIRAAGGHVEAVGMPVDPGNLLVLGELSGKPVIGAPGCARSPKENGFDWILARLLAGETVTRHDIAGLGVGGLLSEIPSRPHPRVGAEEPEPAKSVRVGAIVLAAGSAARMSASGAHKLLAEFKGQPLVRRIVREAQAAQVDAVTVVTGHRSADIEAALAGCPVHLIHNADHANGMASSLQVGIATAIEDEDDGAIVVLADMPQLTTDHFDRLVEQFRQHRGQAIIRAVADGKRGNPVVLPRATFSDVMRLSGDVGARHIIENSGLPVIDVEIGAAALVDVDTPEAVIAAGGVLKS